MSREPNGEPWPESYLDDKFIVASIEYFHKALDCLSSWLNETVNTRQNEIILEHSGLKDTLDELKDTSSHGCYSNLATVLFKNEQGSTGTKTVKTHVFQIVSQTL